MIRLSGSVCIDAPSEDVWARLARLEDIRLWSEAVLDARCEGAVSRGVGAERTCDLRGGVRIKERWLAWNEGRSFTYEGVGIPLVARARNEWTVQAEGDRTLLGSRAEVVLKGGRFGRLLEPIVAAHVLICFLALVLIRLAETRTGETWRTIRAELGQIREGHFRSSEGEFTQTSELTPRQRELHAELGIPEPPRFGRITPAATAQQV